MGEGGDNDESVALETLEHSARGKPKARRSFVPNPWGRNPGLIVLYMLTMMLFLSSGWAVGITELEVGSRQYQGRSGTRP